MPHGTHSCYSAGCRETDCRRAHATYERRMNRRRSALRRQERPPLPTIPVVSLAWLAGLLEGEGSFVVSHEGASVRQAARTRISVQVAMTDEDVVRRVAAIVGKGAVNQRRPSNPAHKVSYQWCLSGRRDAEDLMLQLYPYMGERRQEQIRKALSTLH